MKKIAAVLTMISFLLVNSSCDKTKDDINEATEFTINYAADVEIPETGIVVSIPEDFETPEIPTQSTTRFAAEKTAEALIDEIVLTRFKVSNAGGTLDFIKEASIFITSTNQGDIQVATISNIPAGTTNLEAVLSGANIKEHIFNDLIKFRVTLITDTDLTKKEILKLEQTVTVKGKKIK